MPVNELEKEIYLYLEEAKVIKQIKEIYTIIRDYMAVLIITFLLRSISIKKTMYILNETKI